MLNYLHGIISMHISNNLIVVESSGIGFEVRVTSSDDFPIGESMFVYVVEIINEKENSIIGFKTMKEKSLYLNLTSISGIGPKIALSILSSYPCETIINSINNKDEAFLMRLPSVGKKNAEMILLKLAGKLTIFDSTTHSLSLNKNMDLAFDALKKLGFKDDEISEVFLQIHENDLSVEEYLNKSLKLLAK